MKDLGCQNPQTPEPTDIKFGLNNYVGNTGLRAKIRKQVQLSQMDRATRFPISVHYNYVSFLHRFRDIIV